VNRADAKAAAAMTRIVAAVFFIVGIVLLPQRAVAAVLPTLIAYDMPVSPTATTWMTRESSARPERGGVPEDAYDAVRFGYDSDANPQAPVGTGAVHPYNRARSFVERHDVREGGIYGAPVPTTAAEGGLLADEAAGGHLLARHVGLDAAALDARLAAQGNLTVASSFTTRAEAEAARSAVMGQNVGAISSWTQAGAAGRLTVSGQFSGGTIRVLGGYSADATGATFVLQGNGSGGFFTLTGFPTP
jgi:hypothetical protein